jgi:hypothetical protein
MYLKIGIYLQAPSFVIEKSRLVINCSFGCFKSEAYSCIKHNEFGLLSRFRTLMVLYFAAIKVILYQESLVKIAPTIAAAMAPNTEKPLTSVQKLYCPS